MLKKILIATAIFLVGVGVGKFSNTTEEIKKSSDSVQVESQLVSSDQSLKAAEAESTKTSTKKRTYYPSGVLKSEVDISSESIKQKYEEQIRSLKMTIETMAKQSMSEHTVKFDCPKNSFTAAGGWSGEKVGFYQRQLFKNISVGGGGYQMPICGSGLLGSASFSF